MGGPATLTTIRTAPNQAGPSVMVGPAFPRWAAFALIFGAYLSLRGYHAFDGDQAYRLPILLHQQDPGLYPDDPFVRAFAVFNPHRGYLALIDAASRPFGLATALVGLFAITLTATAAGVDRLARSAWPGAGGRVGLVAVVLVLLAKGGNIGTTHLFEATLLDRLVAASMGWLALASAVADPGRGWRVAVPLLGLAALVHPSVGLQLALTLGAAWACWAWAGRRTGMSGRDAALAVLGLALALAPGLALNAGQGGALFRGRPVEEFRQLAVLVQMPQHMLPSTWRISQWVAWGCYPVLALLAFVEGRPRPWPAARVRLAVLMAVNLASLAAAYVAVEVVGNLRVTLFQPFRMATLARGLALVAASGRIVALWDRGDLAGRSRAALVAVGLAGDWMLAVATAVDIGMALAGRFGARAASDRVRSRIVNFTGLAILALGLAFLVRHDTEAGHVPLLAGLGALAVGSGLARRVRPSWNRRRLAFALAGAWAVPTAALIVPMVVAEPSRTAWAGPLVGRCRFAEVPTDDLERLALWCRDHTAPTARFIGPPGPKGFRLWSRRPLAFNRAGSPYHAEGLADWAARYRDHVAFSGSTSDFVAKYLADRHALEARYQAMTDAEKADLARRQGADHVLAAAPAREATSDPRGPLTLLRAEGRYAVYQVRDRSGDHQKSRTP